MNKPKNYPHVGWELAKLLDKKGYQGDNNKNFYDNTGKLWEQERISLGYPLAPMYFEVIDWLRDTHGISVYVRSDSGHPDDWTAYIELLGRPAGHEDVECHLMQESYHSALQRGVEEALKLIP